MMVQVNASNDEHSSIGIAGDCRMLSHKCELPTVFSVELCDC